MRRISSRTTSAGGSRRPRARCAARREARKNARAAPAVIRTPTQHDVLRLARRQARAEHADGDDHQRRGRRAGGRPPSGTAAACRGRRGRARAAAVRQRPPRESARPRAYPTYPPPHRGACPHRLCARRRRWSSWPSGGSRARATRGSRWWRCRSAPRWPSASGSPAAGRSTAWLLTVAVLVRPGRAGLPRALARRVERRAGLRPQRHRRRLRRARPRRSARARRTRRTARPRCSRPLAGGAVMLGAYAWLYVRGLRAAMIAMLGQCVEDVVREAGRPPERRLGGAALFGAQALERSGGAAVIGTRGGTPELRQPLIDVGLPVVVGPSTQHVPLAARAVPGRLPAPRGRLPRRPVHAAGRRDVAARRRWRARGPWSAAPSGATTSRRRRWRRCGPAAGACTSTPRARRGRGSGP